MEGEEHRDLQHGVRPAKRKDMGSEKYEEEGGRIKDDAGSSSAPEKTERRVTTLPIWEFSSLGETAVEKEKDVSGFAAFGVKGDGADDDLGRSRLGKMNLKGEKEATDLPKEKMGGYTREGGLCKEDRRAEKSTRMGEQRGDAHAVDCNEGSSCFITGEGSPIKQSEKEPNGPIINGLESLNPDSMYYSLKGPEKLNAGGVL